MERLELEFAFFKDAFQHFNHFAAEINRTKLNKFQCSHSGSKSLNFFFLSPRYNLVFFLKTRVNKCRTLSYRLLIDFNGKSSRQELFYAKRLRIAFFVYLYLHFLCHCFLRVLGTVFKYS